MTGVLSKWRLGDLVSFVSGGTPSKQVDTFWGGDTPWISAKDLKSLHVRSSIDTLSDTGRARASLVPPGTLLILVRGMTLFKSIPIGIACREVAINQDLKGLITKGPITPAFLAYSLLAKEDELLQMVEAAGHGTGRLDTEVLKGLALRIPSLPEQAEIVEAIGTWDTAIQSTEQLITAKKRYWDHFRGLLLRRSEKAPLTKLRAITRELTTRNRTILGREAIMAVTKHAGLRPMRKETIASDIARYKVLPPRAFAYNPMRLNIGSIAMSRFDSEVLVSPDYVVFACDESRLLPGYLNHLRRSRSWKSHFEVAGNGSVRIRIYYDDLGTFSFRLPSIAEQVAIVEILDAAELEIALLQQQAEALRKQKRGLMRKLLTGQWRLPLPEQEAL